MPSRRSTKRPERKRSDPALALGLTLKSLFSLLLMTGLHLMANAFHRVRRVLMKRHQRSRDRPESEEQEQDARSTMGRTRREKGHMGFECR